MNATCCEKHAGERSEATASLAVKAARLADALEQGVKIFLAAGDQNLGDFEVQLEQQSRELLRVAAEKGAQQKADQTPPVCPVCGKPLSRVTAGHQRSFECKFGSISIGRSRGYCKRCRKWRFPAAAAGDDDDVGMGDVGMGGKAPDDGQLEQRLESAGRGAQESSMKHESAISEN